MVAQNKVKPLDKNGGVRVSTIGEPRLGRSPAAAPYSESHEDWWGVGGWGGAHRRPSRGSPIAAAKSRGSP